MDKELEQRILQKFNELFIWKRNEYILQNKDGSYSNSKTLPFNTKLTDSVMLNHIKKWQTVGVFGNPNNCKFICFDVDDTDNCKKIVNSIVNEIVNLGIGRQFINVSDSTNKGYHVFLFFDSMSVYQSEAQLFYKFILQRCGLTEKQVEYRATSKSGVRLPLSIHKKTNKVSYFVDENFNQIRDYEYFLSIRQFDSMYFKEIVDSLKLDKKLIKMNKQKRAEFYTNLLDKITIEKAIELEESGLKSIGTRNESCMALIRLYNTRGLSKQQALDRINDWMDNQDKSTYTTNRDTWIKENKKIADWVYKNNVRFHKSKNSVMKYTLSELENIVKYKNSTTKMMAFAFFVQANRFDRDSFYFTYSDIMDKCDIGSKETLSNNMKILKEDNFVSVINLKEDGNRNYYYDIASGSIVRENHMYRYNFKHDGIEETKECNILEGDFKSMFKNMFQLNYDKKKLLSMFGRRQYNTFFSLS